MKSGGSTPDSVMLFMHWCSARWMMFIEAREGTGIGCGCGLGVGRSADDGAALLAGVSVERQA